MPSEQQAESAVHIPSDDARPAFGSCREQPLHWAALFTRDPSPGAPPTKRGRGASQRLFLREARIDAASMDKTQVNFRYKSDLDSPLKDIIARNPDASLQDIWRAHPILRTMSLDHLGLQIDQIIHRRDTAWLK